MSCMVSRTAACSLLRRSRTGLEATETPGVTKRTLQHVPTTNMFFVVDLQNTDRTRRPGPDE
jgi:hypothetical protein